MQIGLYGEIGQRIGREIAHRRASATRTVADLRRALAREHPAAAELLLSPRLKAFIADTQVDDTAALTNVARVEFLPPLSGG